MMYQTGHSSYMPHVTLLISETEMMEDGNYLRFSNELLKRGYQVSLCFIDSIAMRKSIICAEGFTVSTSLQAGLTFPRTHTVNLQESEIIWVLGIGLRQSFLDKIQLLYCLENDCKVINTPNCILNLKSKYSLASHGDIFQYPVSYASTNPRTLFSVIEESGKKWIAKPPAGSMGKDVFLLSADDPNTRVILETMTGANSDQYCLIQSYVEEIQKGEKRVLFAGGTAVGQYRRLATRDHRTNIVQGADYEACDLNAEELAYCEKIGPFLMSQGAAFVGMDLAFPFVIEFNVINPGGLLTIESLDGTDLTEKIIEGIFPEAI